MKSKKIMKKSIVLWIVYLLSLQYILGQNTEKMDIFMIKAQLQEINMDIDFVPTFVKTPDEFIFLSSNHNLYVLGREGLIKALEYPNFEPANSFTVAFQGNLCIVQNLELKEFDDVSNDFISKITLPKQNLSITSGKDAIYIYDNYEDLETTKYSVYKLFQNDDYIKIIDAPSPVNAVLEMNDFVLFSTQNILYTIDMKNKVMKEIASLENKKDQIISIAFDEITESLYFSSQNAIFRLKAGEIACVNDQFGGLLQCDEMGLVIFNPQEQFIVRMRNNSLFTANAKSVQKPTDSAPNSTTNTSNTSTPSTQIITYDVPTRLTSTSGEQITAHPGDYFEGEMESDKIKQGKLYNKDGAVRKIFFHRKN